MFEFYISELTRRELEEIFSDIEKGLLGIELPSSIKDFLDKPPEFFSNGVKEMIMILRKNAPAPLFEDAVHKQLTEELSKRLGRVIEQKSIEKFYNTEWLPQNQYSIEDATFLLFGPPEYPQLKLFTKQNDLFYTQKVTFPKFEVCHSYGKLYGNIEFKIENGAIEQWSNDYKALRQRILEEGKDHSKMLVKTSSRIPDKLLEKVIETSFIRDFLNYEKP